MSQRRLAAIMFTDIVGYDSLLKEDEKKAFEYLRKNQRIHRRLIKKFNGRWLKEMGEGILASFNSNIDAVMCAVSIQKATTEVEIPVRIGIHQGDVIFEKKDVLGDGVNVASRIQNAVSSNSIVISETVYNDIKNKEGIEIDYLGEQPLKGVKKPVGIYKVTCQDENLLDFSFDTGELVRPFSFGRTTIVVGIMVIALVAYALYYLLPKVINPPSKQDQSVLVLPFTNYTGDTLDYFVEGMHDILIGNVGKISALRVLGRTTANAYKDTEKSLTEIAEELGVNTFIEGSVLCLGDDSVCLQVQVRSAYPQEKQLWIKDFKVERSEILNLYNRVTKEISSEIGKILTPKEEQLLARSRTVDKEVYDSYLRAQKYAGDLSRESLYKSLDYLNSAIEKEPDWAPLYSALASIWMYINQTGYEPVSVTFPEIYKNLYKALELDPNLSEVHRGLALIAYLVEWDWEKSEKEFLKALAINPNDAIARALYGQLLCNLQRIDEGVVQGRLALELDPLSSEIKVWSGSILLCAGDFKTALALAEEITAANPGDILGNSLLEAAAFRCKEYDKMMKTWRYILPMLFNFTEEDIKEIEMIFNDQGYLAAYEKILKHLEEYSENNYISATIMATSYIMANQPDKAMDWLEKGFEQHDPGMPNITSIFYFEPLFNNPRFIAICKKMNLPLP